MRLIYFGSGEFGLPTLERLVREHEVVLVVTQPDRPAGRERKLTATAVGAWAEAAGLEVIKTERASEGAVVERVRGAGADAGVVIAFGQKLSGELIEAAGRLCVNLHASLLPKYRGAAPINWAVIHGERETGLSVISLSQKMDGGLVYGQAATAIGERETAGELHDRLAAMGPELVARVLRDFEAGSLKGGVQDEALATRAPKLSKADGKVDFAGDANRVMWRVHGLTPWPGVRVVWESAGGKSKELILRRVAAEPDYSCVVGQRGKPAAGTVVEGHRVAVGDGAVRLLEVQLPGGRVMEIEEFTRGHRMAEGDVLRAVE